MFLYCVFLFFFLAIGGLVLLFLLFLVVGSSFLKCKKGHAGLGLGFLSSFKARGLQV